MLACRCLQPSGANWISPGKVSHHLFVNGLERYFSGGGDASQIIVFRRGAFCSIGLFDDFDSNRAEAGLNHFRSSVEDHSADRIVTNADGGGFTEENVGKFFFAGWIRNDAEQSARPVLLHLDRRKKNIAGASGKQTLENIIIKL